MTEFTSKYDSWIFWDTQRVWPLRSAGLLRQLSYPFGRWKTATLTSTRSAGGCGSRPACGARAWLA